MRYVLGLDQGGSKTHAMIADEDGNILGMGRSYGACHSSTGLEHAVTAIIKAADQALGQCGLQRKDINVIVGGLTGVDWDDEAGILEAAIRVYFPESDIVVVNDCIIAMRGGTKKRDCAILCIGSGFNCAVQSGDECFVYGFYIPDEYQGGFCLGIKTIQAVLDAHIGIVPETVLTQMVLEYFQIKSVDALLYMKVKGKIKDRDYLYLPMLLEKAALSGDQAAAAIWEDYGRHVAVYLTARMEKMGILENEADIVLSGSIFKCRYKNFIGTVKKEIYSKAPNVSIIEARYEPVVGAVLMAVQKLRGTLPEQMEAHLEEAAEKYEILRMRDE